MTERPPPAEEGLIAKIVPGAVTFQDREAMTKMSAVSPVGTLAYVIEEEALLVRVNNGWQYIAVRDTYIYIVQKPRYLNQTGESG